MNTYRRCKAIIIEHWCIYLAGIEILSIGVIFLAFFVNNGITNILAKIASIIIASGNIFLDVVMIYFVMLGVVIPILSYIMIIILAIIFPIPTLVNIIYRKHLFSILQNVSKWSCSKVAPPNEMGILSLMILPVGFIAGAISFFGWGMFYIAWWEL